MKNNFDPGYCSSDIFDMSFSFYVSFNTIAIILEGIAR